MSTNLLSCLIGVVGSFLISLIFYYKAKTKKKLVRKISTVCIISKYASEINGLEINNNGYPIDNLYSSTIQIKNVGNCIVNNTDIPNNHSFSISTDGIFIIDKQDKIFEDKLNKNNAYLNFKKEKNGSSSTAVINFEYISQKQLLSFSVLHTNHISFDEWNLKEGKILESTELLDFEEVQNKMNFPIIIILIIVAIYVFTSGLFFNMQQKNQALELKIESLNEEVNEYKYRINTLNYEIKEILNSMSIDN